jgi:hypothetical protein
MPFAKRSGVDAQYETLSMTSNECNKKKKTG